ncbi:hypothetical protein HA466_0283200 [Hirschfeldia incana]|nr:hypothetical protein HA466_0283200 [Hirschfeldia incana]
MSSSIASFHLRFFYSGSGTLQDSLNPRRQQLLNSNDSHQPQLLIQCFLYLFGAVDLHLLKGQLEHHSHRFVITLKMSECEEEMSSPILDKKTMKKKHFHRHTPHHLQWLESTQTSNLAYISGFSSKTDQVLVSEPKNIDEGTTQES